jgi:hypothetical protein
MRHQKLGIDALQSGARGSDGLIQQGGDVGHSYSIADWQDMPGNLP